MSKFNEFNSDILCEVETILPVEKYKIKNAFQ